jgi:hypothetical protein
MIQPRLNQSAAFRARVALEAIRGDEALAGLAHKHDVSAAPSHAGEASSRGGGVASIRPDRLLPVEGSCG